MGRLNVFEDPDATCATRLTRSSVERELTHRRSHPRSLAVGTFCTLAGIDSKGLQALVRAGLVTRDRRGQLTRESVRHWAAGYRPDLLEAIGNC